MILLDAATTAVFDVDINNDSSSITFYIKYILSLMRGVTDTMQSIKIFGDVSLFAFLIALSVMSIVIVYLINIAKRPNIRTSGSHQRGKKDED